MLNPAQYLDFLFILFLLVDLRMVITENIHKSLCTHPSEDYNLYGDIKHD